MLDLELEHLFVDIHVAMDLGFPDQVANGVGVAAISVHRRLLVSESKFSLDIKLLLGNARPRAAVRMLREFAHLPALSHALKLKCSDGIMGPFCRRIASVSPRELQRRYDTRVIASYLGGRVE
jgi:hypothetical protein